MYSIMALRTPDNRVRLTGYEPRYETGLEVLKRLRYCWWRESNDI